MINRRKTKFMIRDIENAVCLRFGLTIQKIRSDDTRRSVARPRQIAWLLAREMTSASYPLLGRHFGNRHHSTVVLGCKSIRRVMQTSPDVVAEIDGVRELLAVIKPTHDILAEYFAAGLHNPMREAA